MGQMSPHRRRCIRSALLELRSVIADITVEEVLELNDRELTRRFEEAERAIEGAHATEPAPPMKKL